MRKGAKVREQIHGGDIYRHTVETDFSVNSNPLGPPEAVAEAVRNSAMRIVRYPDVQCERLCSAISDFEGVEASEILCGNGAAELFFAAVLAVKPKKALLPAPTFAEYENALRLTCPEIRYYELRAQDGFAVQEDLLDLLDAGFDMLFLCNPNNPTGVVMEKELLRRVLKKCKKHGTVLVLDECFLEFLEEPERYEMQTYRGDFPELLVIKAFTKIFCMPGLRLGYAVSGNEPLLRKMASCMQPWNVSVPAQEAGVAALADCAGYLRDTRVFVKKERERLIWELARLGYETFASKANYVFFKGQAGLYEKALQAGYLIRDCRNYRGLSQGYYRIAVRGRQENERLMEWLRQL